MASSNVGYIKGNSSVSYNSAGHKTAEAKKYMTDLGNTLSDLKSRLSKLKQDIESIEAGKTVDNKKSAIWSGRTAVNYVKTLKLHYNNHVKVYNSYVVVYNELYYYFHKSSIQLG